MHARRFSRASPRTAYGNVEDLVRRTLARHQLYAARVRRSNRFTDARYRSRPLVLRRLFDRAHRRATHDDCHSDARTTMDRLGDHDRESGGLVFRWPKWQIRACRYRRPCAIHSSCATPRFSRSAGPICQLRRRFVVHRRWPIIHRISVRLGASCRESIQHHAGDGCRTTVRHTCISRADGALHGQVLGRSTRFYEKRVVCHR